MMAPFLEEIAHALAGKAKVVKLNIVENPELAAQYGIRGSPTPAIFKVVKSSTSWSGPHRHSAPEF